MEPSPLRGVAAFLGPLYHSLPLSALPLLRLLRAGWALPPLGPTGPRNAIARLVSLPRRIPLLVGPRVTFPSPSPFLPFRVIPMVGTLKATPYLGASVLASLLPLPPLHRTYHPVSMSFFTVMGWFAALTLFLLHLSMLLLGMNAVFVLWPMTSASVSPPFHLTPMPSILVLTVLLAPLLPLGLVQLCRIVCDRPLARHLSNGRVSPVTWLSPTLPTPGRPPRPLLVVLHLM